MPDLAPANQPVGSAVRVKFHEARRHFQSGGEVLVSEYGEQTSIPVWRHTTTHSRDTVTWEVLAEQVRMWRNRYPYQRWYIVRRDTEVNAHKPCPDYPGQWYDKSTGACSCGASHNTEEVKA